MIGLKLKLMWRIWTHDDPAVTSQHYLDWSKKAILETINDRHK